MIRRVTSALRQGMRVLFRFALALILAGLAWLFGSLGFDNLRELRQLERTPRALIATLLVGEANVEGRVIAEGELLRGPETAQPAVYYRHHVERRYTDSEGRTRWRTVRDDRRHVPFLLDDASARVRVVPDDAVDFRSRQRHTRRAGDMRYTEYRIDPGDTVFVFAWAEHSDGAMELRFATPGQYTPIISMDGEASARGGMAGTSLFLLWLGLVAASFTIYILAWKLQLHATALYLILLCLALASGQLYLASQMARADLSASHDRLERDLHSAADLIGSRLHEHGIAWDGDWNALGDFDQPRYWALPAAERQLLEHVRERIAAQSERTAAIARQFPERWLTAGLRLPQAPAIPLPDYADHAYVRSAREGTRTSHIGGWVFGSLGLGLSIVFSVFGFRRIRLKRLIEDLPTSASTGVAYGLAELAARAALPNGDTALEGPLTGRECVWFRYKEEERRGSGRNARWVTLVDRRSDRRFLLEDDHGSIPIDPAGAEVIQRDPAVRRRGRRRFTEWLFEPGTRLYALGSAEIDPQTQSSLALRRGPREHPFIVTDLSERELKLRKARGGFALLNLSLNAGNGMALAVVGSLGALHGAGLLSSALVPLGYTFLFLAILMYNGLVGARLRMHRAWANIQVSLNKRADLVPNLEQVLKAYLEHERGVQTALTELRTLAARTDADLALAGRLLTLEQSLIERFAVLREAHPELLADVPAARLMRQLIALENEVALMRMGYNDCVERYNTRRQQFPEVLFARAFSFEPAEPLRAELQVHALPPLDLDPDGADLRDASDTDQAPP